MVLLIAQLADDCGYVVFLEEANGGYAGGAGLEAGLGVVQSYSSQREDRDFFLAGLAKCVEALRVGSWCVSFFKDRS